MAKIIQLRRDTLTSWEFYNPILANGEPGYVELAENEPGILNSSGVEIRVLLKIGNGVQAWLDLPYVGEISTTPDGEGTQGPQGSAGAQGPQGSAGAQGPQGSAGAQGQQGSAGAQGQQGSAGAQGQQGSAGAQGQQGSAGAQGQQGSAGAQGSAGTQGYQGAQGSDSTVPGPQGAQGQQGSEANLITHLQEFDHSAFEQAIINTKEPHGYVRPPVTPIWGGTNNRVLTFPGPDLISFQGKHFEKSNYSFDANLSGNGKFYFYWVSDGSGGIETEYGSITWDLDNLTLPIAIPYISTNNVDYGREWHGCRMDVDTHARFHYVDGAKIEFGGFTVEASDTGIFIDEGTLWDDDIPLVIPEQTTVRVAFYDGSSYEGLTRSQYSAYTGSVPQYNNAGVPTELTQGYFGLYWIILTHFSGTPCTSILHTGQYDNISEAHEAFFHTNIRQVMASSGFSSQEMQPLACVIVQNILGSPIKIDQHDLSKTNVHQRQDTNPESHVHFTDVYLHGLSGSVLGNSRSVFTSLKNLDLAVASAVYYPVEIGRIVAGTAPLSGSVSTLQTLDASIAGSITIDEQQTTKFTYRLKIEPTGAFNKIQFAAMYPGSPHVVIVYVVKADGITKTELCRWGTGGTVQIPYSVWYNNIFDLPEDYNTYLQAGAPNFFELEIDHQTNGSSGHNLYVDKVALIKSSAGVTPPDASEDVKGITKFATLAEVALGTNKTKAVTSEGVATKLDRISGIATNLKEKSRLINTVITEIDWRLGHVVIYDVSLTNLVITNVPTDATAFLTIKHYHVTAKQEITWNTTNIESLAASYISEGTVTGFDKYLAQPSGLGDGKFTLVCVESK